MGYSRKNPHPHDGRHAEKFPLEGRLTALEIQRGGGSWNVKIHPQGLLSILLIFQLLQLIKKNCFAFSNFIILSNYRPLNTFTLSFHP